MSHLTPAAAGGIDPVVIALTQLEQREKSLRDDLAEAQAAEDAARTAARNLEVDLQRTSEALGVLRKLTGSAAAPVRRARARVADTPPVSPTLTKGHHGAAAAALRERVVLQLIADGHVSSRAIREAMAVPHGATAEQHRVSVSNALTRLRAVRGLVTTTDAGWALTAKGRKHLAAVKEEP